MRAKRPGANGNRGETTHGANGIRGETTQIPLNWTTATGLSKRDHVKNEMLKANRCRR